VAPGTAAGPRNGRRRATRRRSTARLGLGLPARVRSSASPSPPLLWGRIGEHETSGCSGGPTARWSPCPLGCAARVSGVSHRTESPVHGLPAYRAPPPASLPSNLRHIGNVRHVPQGLGHVVTFSRGTPSAVTPAPPFAPEEVGAAPPPRTTRAALRGESHKTLWMIQGLDSFQNLTSLRR